MYELVDTDASLQFFGNVFVPELTSSKPVIVDGDLVCNWVCAPELSVRNGSLIARYIEVPKLHADILGVFDLSRPFSTPNAWTYKWLRPIVDVPNEAAWKSEESIVNVATLFARPEIVTDPVYVHHFIDRILSRPSCLRARVLFAVAIEALSERPESLTPLGRQVVVCFTKQESLPHYWRF